MTEFSPKNVLKRIAPIAIGASSMVNCIPVHSALPKGNEPSSKENKIELLCDQYGPHDETPELALVEMNHADAYSQSIAQVSIDTETGSYNNQPAVATGNGYYGQHQMGNAQQNDYCVKKYIAYALLHSTPEFKESLCKNLLKGNPTLKDKLINNFGASLEKYEESQKLEKAYLRYNPAYQQLYTIMNVTPAKFKAAHKDFTEEAKHLQTRFIYDVYLQQMSISLKDIIAKNPQVKFETLHPSVMSAVVAIAVKQGNGSRFSKAIKEATVAAYKQQVVQTDSSDKLPPVVVACRSQKLNPENICVSGKLIRVYDAEKSGLNSKDILTEKGYNVVVVHAQKPKNVSGQRAVATFNMQTDKADVSSIINNKNWLAKYCGDFKRVYQRAVKDIDKIPTLNTYYEMSLILNNPNVYKIAEDLSKQDKEPPTLAWNDAVLQILRNNKYQNS